MRMPSRKTSSSKVVSKSWKGYSNLARTSVSTNEWGRHFGWMGSTAGVRQPWASSRNVSAGGAFIETDLHLPGELMTMTFELLGRPFKFQAEVVRVMEAGFGVRFYVDLQQQAALREMLTRL